MNDSQQDFSKYWQVFHPKNLAPIAIFEVKSVAEQFVSQQPFPDQHTIVQIGEPENSEANINRSIKRLEALSNENTIFSRTAFIRTINDI